MKKILFLAAFLPACLFGAQSIGIHVGSDYTFRTDISNSGQKVGYAMGARYGYEFGSGVKGELEVNYREGHKRTKYHEDTEDNVFAKTFSSKHSWSYMVNLNYEASQLSSFDITPYLGAGIGMCSNVDHYKIKSDYFSSSEKQRDKCFAWQGHVGVKYPIAVNYALNARYSYFVGQAHSKSHSVTCGLERAF